MVPAVGVTADRMAASSACVSRIFRYLERFYPISDNSAGHVFVTGLTHVLR